jgi:hypothetical protein
VVAELNGQGQPWRSFIYANGQVLAEQDDVYPQVVWKHRSPSNNSEFVSLTGSTGASRLHEYDPMGTEFGDDDPYLNGGNGGYGDWTGGRGVPSDLTTGCSWEGMAIGCEFALKFTNWRGYTSGGLRITSRTIPGVGIESSQLTHVKSRVIGAQDDSWSAGDIIEYKNFTSTPNNYQTSIILTKHVRVIPETTTVPCDVQISGDRSRAMVAVALGEGTPFRDRDSGPGQYPKAQVTTEPFLPLTEQEFRNEAFYMASVIANRFNTGAYGSYADVVNERAVSRNGSPGQRLFRGIDAGWGYLNQLGNNGDENCERARYMMDALSYIFDQGHGSGNDLMYWRGVHQPGLAGDRRPFRQGDQRAANTDFMHLDPTSLEYNLLPYLTVNGWRYPRRR